MDHALLSRAVKAGRRARRAAGGVRRRIERVDTVPVLAARLRPRPVLRPVHLSVLGGRTLNVAVRYPRRAQGIGTALLHLNHRGHRRTAPLTPELQPDGTLLLTATAPLHFAPHDEPAEYAEPGALALGPGIWRLSLAVTDTAGREILAGLGAAPPRTGGGPTLPHSPDPGSGAVFRPVRSPDKRALLKVTAPAPQAELVALGLRWDRVTVQVRLVGPLPRHAVWTAEAVRQGSGGTVLPMPLEQHSGHLTADLPLPAMAADGHVQHTWEVRLRSGRTRLKVGRRLTDVRRPKRVFRTPYRSIALADGRLLRVHAQFSAAGTLAVSCAAYAPPARAHETSEDRP
ncbi:hypothetical protein [Streptomyces ochraceiscleroticus]|uniref:Transferase n=1 Tax=Streptomyces ochraceiscleroticus TaxID=47761 RepID=A0ABW1MEY9_9ACTN|nr:hypothetical protein [Streptomyces ochraceiscleroticus]